MLCTVQFSYGNDRIPTFEEVSWAHTIERNMRSLTKIPGDRHTMSTLDTSGWDAGYYDLDIHVSHASRFISGNVAIRGKSTRPGLQRICIDLHNDLVITGISGNTGTWNRIDGGAEIFLNTAYDTGDMFSISVSYSGTPPYSGWGGYFLSWHSGTPIVSTLSEPDYARTWWPCKDIPADKADSADIHITCSSLYTAVSNGRLMDLTDNGNGTATWHWKEQYPITTYLVSLAITNYTSLTDYFHYSVQDSMPVNYYIYPEHVSDVLENISETPGMLEYFSTVFGMYPFIGERYGMAEFSWGGGMEHQTCSSMGSFSRVIIAHELAHQWWGDMVTCADWHHIWLNEGFATYAEALYFGDRISDAAYRGYMSHLDHHFDPPTVYVEDISDAGQIFNNTVYDKGAWVLHMLRGILGDQLFFNGLNHWRNSYYMSSATTEQFRAVMEQVSGEDLSGFFQQWIYGSGRPHYRYWLCYQENGDDIVYDMYVRQIQNDPTVFCMPLDLVIRGGNDSLSMTILNSQIDQRWLVVSDFVPQSMELDPLNRVLKYTTLFTEPRMKGDIIRDGEINIQDVIRTVDFILRNVYMDIDTRTIVDLNYDTAVDVLDCIHLVRRILGDPVYMDLP